MTNPFAVLNSSPPPEKMGWELPASEKAPHIPQEDLLGQIEKQSGELVDVLKEIDFLAKLRERLERHNEQRSAKEARSKAVRAREKLRSKFEGGFGAYQDFDVLKAIEDTFVELYPIENFEIELAKEYRNISKDIANLYERYQKIIKGITINVNFTDKHYDRLLRTVFKVVPMEYQIQVAEELDKYAVGVGEPTSIEL